MARDTIREMLKTFPNADASLIREFFPVFVKCGSERYQTNAEKKFWKKGFPRVWIACSIKAFGA